MNELPQYCHFKYISLRSFAFRFIQVKIFYYNNIQIYFLINNINSNEKKDLLNMKFQLINKVICYTLKIKTLKLCTRML